MRHIVNRVLAQHGSELPRQVIDDIRKFVSKAEEKYKFSAFGGDVNNLAKYINSKDFDDVVTIFKSTGRMDILRKILEEARESYKDTVSVLNAINRRLQELGYVSSARLDEWSEVKRALESLHWVKSVESLKDKLIARGNGVELIIETTTDSGRKSAVYELVIRGEASSFSDVLPELTKKIKSLT